MLSVVKPLPLNPKEKICYHIDAVFGMGVSDGLSENLQFQYSRRTGRIKNFSIGNQLFATLRTDGGLALTIFGAKELFKNRRFKENCIIPSDEAVPFISVGRSVFCKYVEWCGSNVKVGSDVAIIDKNDMIIAIGRALFGSDLMRKCHNGVAVKIREGIKSRIK
ncbi:MAG: PUA domain-containing protein [Nitrososphaeraceae archaeon]